MSNKVPKIRFNGYSDAWVQRNLGEVVQKVKSYSLSREVETEDDTGFEYIHYGDIHTQKADVIDGNTKLPSIVPGDYDLIQEGDVIVADASEDYLGIAEPAVVVNKPTENLVAGLHTIAIRPNGIHPLFLYYLLHTQLFKHFGYRTGTGLKVFGISYPNLAKFTFAMPTLDEQKAIANTLRDMDNLIAANQRKLDLLKEQKKGYLQKMFPKNGAKVPELRFAGFADDWEERKLSSGLREYTDRVIVEDDKEYYQISVRNNFGGITLRGSKMGNKIGRKRQAKINLTKYPQTLIFTRQTVEQGGIGWVDKYCDGAIVTENMPTISLDTSVFSKCFLTNLFQTRIFYKNAILDNVDGGSAQIAIHESKLLSSTLLFPNLDEQEKIGQFFKQLDNTIALHQRKLDLLKKQKKGLLQKMFV